MLSPHLYHACRKPRRISDANGHLRQVDTKRQPQGTQGRGLGWRLSGGGVCFVGLSNHQGHLSTHRPGFVTSIIDHLGVSCKRILLWRCLLHPLSRSRRAHRISDTNGRLPYMSRPMRKTLAPAHRAPTMPRINPTDDLCRPLLPALGQSERGLNFTHQYGPWRGNTI